MTPQQAYGRVRAALKSGELVRPDSCSRCGRSGVASDGRSIIQAHHHDYSKPLEVEWICSACHRAETPLPEVMGGKAIGTINGQSKLDVDKVKRARLLRKTGITYQKIADLFDVSKSTVMRAIKGQLWSHV